MTDSALQNLVDENEVKKLLVRLSFGVDERDIAKCRAVFADEVYCDFDPLGGDKVEALMQADFLAPAIIERVSQFQMTQHVNTMHDVVVTGDDATLSAYVIGSHYLSPDTQAAGIHRQDPWNTIGARYEMKAHRFPHGWRFTTWVWRLMWSRDNHDVWNEVGRRIKAKESTH